MNAFDFIKNKYRNLCGALNVLKNVMLCCAILILLNACAPSLNGNFCDLYEPVYTVPEDTLETQKQIDRNNTIWVLDCHDLDSESIL